MLLSKQESIEKFRQIERDVAAWLMRRGCRILPVYDYSGLGENKAPKLQAFSAQDSLITPDLLVARRGLLQWCEVKWKDHAEHTILTNEYETGIGQYLFAQYRLVKHVSGARVFIVFAHRQENVITCNELDDLSSIGARAYNEDKMDRGGMWFWPLRKLHVLAKYDDVIKESALFPRIARQLSLVRGEP
jgi:hypothetical protein